MKKTILAFLFLIISATASEIQQKPLENPFLMKDDFPVGYLLSPHSLPRLIGMYLKVGGQHKINPTEEQEIIFENEFSMLVKVFGEKATKIRDLETKIMQKVIYKGATPKEVKYLIDEIVKLKTDLTVVQIESANLFKRTLNDTQYNQLLEIAKQFTKDNK